MEQKSSNDVNTDKDDYGVGTRTKVETLGGITIGTYTFLDRELYVCYPVPEPDVIENGTHIRGGYKYRPVGINTGNYDNLTVCIKTDYGYIDINRVDGYVKTINDNVGKLTELVEEYRKYMVLLNTVVYNLMLLFVILYFLLFLVMVCFYDLTIINVLFYMVMACITPFAVSVSLVKALYDMNVRKSSTVDTIRTHIDRVREVFYSLDIDYSRYTPNYRIAKSMRSSDFDWYVNHIAKNYITIMRRLDGIF